MPAYAAGQAVLPVGSGRMLAIGRTITLLSASGQVLWHETASISPLDDSMASSGGPQASGMCALAGDGAGHRYDFISLATGRQAVVTENPAEATGSFILAGRRAVLPDGTIRNACTGAVMSRAAPNGTFTSLECLSGSMARAVVIGAGKPGQMAWRNGHELWHQKTSGQVICDPRKSVAMLDTGAQFRFLNPLTGQTRWTVTAPGCPGRCAGSTSPSGPLLGGGNTVVLAVADQVLALARSDGKLLWRQSPACALAVRSLPSPEVLLGPCSGISGEAAGTATAADLQSGGVISRFPVTGTRCTGDSEWAANSHELVVVCRSPAKGGTAGRARLIHW